MNDPLKPLLREKETGASAGLQVREALHPTDIDHVRMLLREYTDYLATFIRADQLSFEYRIAELAALPGDSIAPLGALLLATMEGQPAGCIAFGPMNLGCGERVAELRRMWVRPAYRGHGIGRELVSAAIARARAAGHSALYLENDPKTMTAAAHLYQSFGFMRTAPQHNDHTLAYATFFRLDLVSGPASTETPSPA